MRKPAHGVFASKNDGFYVELPIRCLFLFILIHQLGNTSHILPPSPFGLRHKSRRPLSLRTQVGHADPRIDSADLG